MPLHQVFMVISVDQKQTQLPTNIYGSRAIRLDLNAELHELYAVSMAAWESYKGRNA